MGPRKQHDKIVHWCNQNDCTIEGECHKIWQKECFERENVSDKDKEKEEAEEELQDDSEEEHVFLKDGVDGSDREDNSKSSKE